MIRPFIFVFITILSLPLCAKEVRDTIYTLNHDRIIISYNISSDGKEVKIDAGQHPRIIPSDYLKQICKGELDKLKIVTFDRIGDFGKVKWSGLTPKAFMVPSGMKYDKSYDGYYIWGECAPIEMRGDFSGSKVIRLPLYIALYEKKQRYKLISQSMQPLVINPLKSGTTTNKLSSQRPTTTSERIAIHSTEEINVDNSDISSALSSINLIREIINKENELPFSMTLQAEINNLIGLKGKINEPEIIEKINEVLLLCNEKERELKAEVNSSAEAQKALERAEREREKQEAAALQQQAEEKAKIQEEKQNKKTLWMIIGGIILGILAFVFNAVFKHFRDLRNQKSIMQMQESLSRQATNEAARRSREIVRNKTHKVMNQSKSKLRNTLNNKGTKNNNNNNNNKLRSI